MREKQRVRGLSMSAAAARPHRRCRRRFVARCQGPRF